MTLPPTTRFGIDRRTFLLGTAAVGFAAACGGETSSSTTTADPFAIVQRFPSDVAVPGEIRLPFSLAQAAEFISDGPSELAAQIVDLDGDTVGDSITAVRRDITPSSYYAFRTTIDTPGIYAIKIDGGPPDGANFQVMERDQVTIPRPGDPLPAFDTPTVDDPAGVDPICTREPACSLHAVTLTEALESGKSVGYFIGTPAFCQTGTCAPALETLLAVAPDYEDDFVFVHAEVWKDLSATEVTPAVDAMGITFEPTLILTDTDGTVIERIDGLWDVTELRERLDAARA